MTLLILAAGIGSRYGGLKQIDPIDGDGNFIIDYSVYDAIRSGFDEVVFIVKRSIYQDFRETIGRRLEGRIRVRYVFQEMDDIPDGFSIPEGRTKPWGTTHAIRAARHVIRSPFGVVNADDFYGLNTFEQLAVHLRKLESGALPDDGVSHCCAIGFRVRNTLTDKGTCSRGICAVDGNGMLTSIVERLKIRKAGRNGESAAYANEEGGWTDLPGDTVTSMNCWGLTDSLFPLMDADFTNFMEHLSERPNPLKAECLLPESINTFMKAGQCDVRVYPTASEWFGVTYPEDKPWVVSSLRRLIDAGAYPAHLWEGPHD